MEIRAVISQCGVAMELHGKLDHPITIALFSVDMLASYRAELAKSSPDMRYAVAGQLAVMLAAHMYGNQVEVSPYCWTYNASEDRYSH